VYKAHLRTYAVEGLRDIIAMGGQAMAGLVAQIEMIRRFQSNEGLTLMDAKDKFETHQYSFSGLAEIIMQFGMQLSGASQIPLVRLFGQSPAGLSSTGESDMRNYYDGVRQKQEAELRPGITPLYGVLYRSTFGKEPKPGFQVKFKPLWQMSEVEKGTTTNTRTAAVVAAFEAQIIDRPMAMRELKQLGDVTGAFSTIDDMAIKQAESEPTPSPRELGLSAHPDAGPQGDWSSEPDEDPSRRAVLREVA
jgi:phage-related protein (TIGR01555 family)